MVCMFTSPAPSCASLQEDKEKGKTRQKVKLVSKSPGPREENGLSFPMGQNKKGYIILKSTQSRSHLEIGHTHRRNLYYKVIF